MIGQTDLKNVFNNFVKGVKPLPRSILLIGAKGSGRKTFANWVAENIKISLVQVGQKVDDIRELSDMCYKLVEPTFFLIADVEQMSSAAQNALLKILEEPPNNVGFILTALQENLILSTIKSRCAIYYINQYSEAELKEYIDLKYPTADSATIAVAYSVCVCPGDIDLLFSHDITEFNDYVNKVFNNIAKVSGANSFKIAQKINLADDDSKIELTLFWRAFINLCMDNLRNGRKYASGITITSKYLQDLRIKGINKQMAFDNWILDIRKEWINADS